MNTHSWGLLIWSDKLVGHLHGNFDELAGGWTWPSVKIINSFWWRLRGNPILLWVLLHGTLCQVLVLKSQERSWLWQWRGRRKRCKICLKYSSREKTLSEPYPICRKDIYQTAVSRPPSSLKLFKKKKKKKERKLINIVKVEMQGDRSTKRLGFNHTIVECFLSSSPNNQINRAPV